MLALDISFATQRVPQDLTLQGRYTSLHSQRRPAPMCHASKTPTVKLDFQTSEGPTSVECESGDILRDVMMDQKVDLYTTWGKVWTCGGSGQCGTCIVKVYKHVHGCASIEFMHTKISCSHTGNHRQLPIDRQPYCSQKLLLPVQVLDGSHLLSERNTTEDKKLKKVKPPVYCHGGLCVYLSASSSSIYTAKQAESL